MTNNGQTPGGNTTTAGAVEGLAMARRICARIVEGDSDNSLRVSAANDYLEGRHDKRIEVQSALAAIIETTEAAAAFIERDVPVEHAGQVVGRCSGDMITAAALRNFDHLKGPKP